MISNDELLKWVNTMPLWFKKATVAYYQKDNITDEEILALADICFSDETYEVKNINLIARDKKNRVCNKTHY